MSYDDDSCQLAPRAITPEELQTLLTRSRTASNPSTLQEHYAHPIKTYVAGSVLDHQHAQINGVRSRVNAPDPAPHWLPAEEYGGVTPKNTGDGLPQPKPLTRMLSDFYAMPDLHWLSACDLEAYWKNLNSTSPMHGSKLAQYLARIKKG